MWDSKKLPDYNLKYIHSITMGQCSETMRQKIKADPGYKAVKAVADVISLLCLIKRLMYIYQSYKYLIQAIHEPLRKFYTLHQGRHAEIQEFLRQFQSQVNIIESVGASVGDPPDLKMAALINILRSDDVNITLYNQQQEVSKTARKQYLAVALATGSDKRPRPLELFLQGHRLMVEERIGRIRAPEQLEG